ncbi:MAG: DUF6452 family protein [Fulvivirga sp.]
MLTFISLAILTGCYEPDCDYQSEPSLLLRIHEATKYTSAYTLKNNEMLEGSDNSFMLPISMNDASTIYVFHAGDLTDTLELEYTKDVRFKSTACGFTLSLDKIKSGAHTTFPSVEIDDDIIDIP